MDRDILVSVVLSIDYEEGSLSVRKITKLENIIQLRICPGMSTQKGEAAAALKAVFPAGLPTV